MPRSWIIMQAVIFVAVGAGMIIAAVKLWL
jgi:hypothetical protein